MRTPPDADAVTALPVTGEIAMPDAVSAASTPGRATVPAADARRARAARRAERSAQDGRHSRMLTFILSTTRP